MKKCNAKLFFAILLIGSGLVSLEVFKGDVLKIVEDIQSPTPLQMDPNHKVSVLFENKLIWEGFEIPFLPLTAVLGDQKQYFGEQMLKERKYIFSVRAFKTNDCAEDEIYAHLTVGERVKKEFVTHAEGKAKVTNRKKNEIQLKVKGSGDTLNWITTPYFAPPKEEKTAAHSFIPTANAKEKSPKELRIYHIQYDYYVRGLKKSGTIVIQEGREGGLESGTIINDTETVSQSMKFKVLSKEDKVELYVDYKESDSHASSEAFATKEVALNEDVLLFNDQMIVKVKEYKK